MSDALFLHVYAAVTREKDAQERLDQFRNLYGFSRNVAFAFFVSAVILLVGDAWGSAGAGYGWATGSALLGIGMLYRYLKFYRQFTFELFLRYAGTAREDSPTRSL